MIMQKNSTKKYTKREKDLPTGDIRSNSGERYIYKKKDGKYYVCITLNGIYNYVGHYQTIEDAVNCRDKYLNNL